MKKFRAPFLLPYLCAVNPERHKANVSLTQKFNYYVSRKSSYKESK